MKWFTIKQNEDNGRNSQVATQALAASIRTKLKDYQSNQGPSEFIGPALSIEDTLSLSEITGSVDYIKVEVDPEASLTSAIPFSIH